MVAPVVGLAALRIARVAVQSQLVDALSHGPSAHISAKLDRQSLAQSERAISRFMRKQYPLAVQRALNRTIDRSRTRVVRDLQKAKRLSSQKELRKQVRAYHAKAPDHLEAKLWIGLNRQIKQKGGKLKLIKTLEGSSSKPFRAKAREGSVEHTFVRYPLPSFVVGTRGGDAPNLPITRVDKGYVWISLMPEAPIIGERVVTEQYRKFYPGELARLIKRIR